MSAVIAPERAVGRALSRVEGREKVTGAARYAYERHEQGLAYAWIVGAAIARGTVRSVDAQPALAAGAVAVLHHGNTPRLCETPNPDLLVLQSPAVAFRGQAVALAVADTLEDARAAAGLVAIDYEQQTPDVLLRPDHPRLYKPDRVNPNFPTDVELGDFEAAFAGAGVRLDATYCTPTVHNNPMEPHATTAVWEGDALTLYDATQGPSVERGMVAEVLGLDPEQVRIVAPHVGGGFGAKGIARPQAILAALAARHVGRPVKLAVTRQQMFTLTGYRTPTIQRVRLGAGADGRIAAIAHDVQEQTSRVREFAEQTATPTRLMYAGANRRTTHRLVALDVPTPSWFRAPGECPGMFALESAMDELALAVGIDPIELRRRNEPERDPERDVPWSSRHLIECLEQGAERFGWAARDPEPGRRRVGRRLLGTGVACSTYPARRAVNSARAMVDGQGRLSVSIAAVDIGTGARTVLTQLAADALGVRPDEVEVRIGDSALPRASLAGGSMGTASWGAAVIGACRGLRERLRALGEQSPGEGLHCDYDTASELREQAELSRHAFGAQFAEVSVDLDSGEVHVPRLLGVFAAGRILNPKTARSQFIGGMTMGLGMALMEESVVDAEYGDYVNHDLAQYHVPVSADVRAIEAHWLDEVDAELGATEAKGIGEIGIVGTAAAIANALHHATGARLRELPLRPDRVLAALADVGLDGR